jgi:HEAT repeat protein
MLRYLFAWLNSPDREFTRLNAISALGYTGARRAVPTLIELLKSADPPAAQRALWSLRQLTHLSLGGDHWLDQPESQYSKWLQWWATQGANAKINKAQECGEIRELPVGM